MRGIFNAIKNILACISLLLWTGVLFKSGTKAYYYEVYEKSDITDDIRTFRFALGFQIFTLITQMVSYVSSMYLVLTFLKIIL